MSQFVGEPRPRVLCTCTVVGGTLSVGTETRCYVIHEGINVSDQITQVFFCSKNIFIGVHIIPCRQRPIREVSAVEWLIWVGLLLPLDPWLAFFFFAFARAGASNS
jgi:hypothetical protein